MMQHTVALRLMLTGRLQDEDVARVFVGADFQTTLEEVERLKEITRIDGNDRIMIGFDVDDPTGPPASFGLWHVRNGVAAFYDRCVPWLPPTGNRACLIGQNAAELAHFIYRPGQTLLLSRGSPAKDPWPGINRALTKLAKLVNTPAVRNAVGDVHLRVACEGCDETFLRLPTVSTVAEPQ